MRQFLYVSTAIGLPEAEVTRIVDTAVHNNLEREITGFLLYSGRNFMQLIEGEEAPLLSLMSDLARDRRHNGMIKLFDEGIERRVCPDWSMRRIPLIEAHAERRARLERDLPAGLSADVRSLVMNFATLN